MRINVSDSANNRQPQNPQGSDTHTSNALLEWWYHLAAPTEPPEATSQDRERVRAGRLASILLLIMFCFGISQLPNAIVSTNHFFLIILLIAMAINVAAFVVNRRGEVFLASATMIFVVEAAFILIVLSSPSALTARALSTFYLIAITELMAVSLLPPKSVFLALLCNAIFTWATISFRPHAADFQLLTPSAFYSAIAGPVALQAILAIVTYLWVQGARQAIERAERVAALERALAERDRQAAEEKQQLEQGIQQILQTHIQAANGNFEARAPLSRDNVLWQVAYGLNTLLARMQRATQSETEFQYAKNEVMRLIEAIRQAKARRYRLDLPKRGTILDPLAHELTGTYIDQS